MSLIRNIGKAAIGRRIKRRSARAGLLGTGIGIVATRIATRSIPGAVLVGGALVARTLYQRRKMPARPTHSAHNSHPSIVAKRHRQSVLRW